MYKKIKIGYIHGYTISHKKLKNVVMDICGKVCADLYVSCIFEEMNTPKLDECDVVFDECRLYVRGHEKQKIFYLFTGMGDLSSYARDTRQDYNSLDYIILPKVRGITDKEKYNKFKMIGNPVSIFYERFYSSVCDYYVKDSIIVPEENCFDMENIISIAQEIADKENLSVIVKKRDNSESVFDIIKFFKRAKYIVTGFSTMMFEGLYFGIKGCLVGGLLPKNVTNNNELFYNSLLDDYPELVVNNYDDFNNITKEQIDVIKNEHYNENILHDIVAIIKDGDLQ